MAVEWDFQPVDWDLGLNNPRRIQVSSRCSQAASDTLQILLGEASLVEVCFCAHIFFPPYLHVNLFNNHIYKNLGLPTI